MIKHIKEKSIICFLLLIMLLIFFKSTSYFFEIFIDLYYKDLNLYFLFYILIVIFLILEYKNFTKKYINEFYYFFFILLFFISVTLLFISTINIFILKKDFMDYLLETTYFKICLIYSNDYKWAFCMKSLDDYLNIFDFNEEKTNIILKIVTPLLESLVLENPRLTLAQLLPYVVFYTEFSIKVYDTMPLLQLEYENLFWQQTSLWYGFFYFLKRIIMVGAFLQVLFTTPRASSNLIAYFCINKFNLHLYIKAYLLIHNVVFENMTSEEIEDICKLLAHKMLENWHSLEILLFVLGFYK